MTTVFKNGRIYTMDRNLPYASALAVRDGRIVYVGTDKGVRDYESGAKVVDLAGKMVISGMIDAHCHPSQYPFLTPGIVLDVTLDHQGTLDAICADKPIFLMSSGIHEGWCNSKTLELAGITADTPDLMPGFSFFQRDDRGTPSGRVVEIPPEMLILKGVSWFSEDQVEQLYRDMFDACSALGITGFVNCGNLDAFEPMTERTIQTLEAQGEMKQRINGCVMVESNEALAAAAAKAGFDIHIHGIGDKAVHENLMAAKAVREGGYYDTRFINAHTQLVRREDLPLFGKYNVLANFSSIWFYCAPDVTRILGEERVKRQYQAVSIIKEGGPGLPGQ